QRISILDGIVKGIYELHKEDLIHHNLHTGNILVRRTRRKEVERISPAGSSNENNDLNSSSSPIDENSNIISNSRKEIYGVLPYIAPEVLQGKEYTKSSDIYSLGIIMWELS
ncbi:kinase-like protein, partial [Rhizophagus irregularis]